MVYSLPQDKAVERVLNRWDCSELTRPKDVRMFSRQLRTLVTTNKRASVCNLVCEVLSTAFSALDIRYELAAGGVFLGPELMPHTWVVLDGGDIPLSRSGPLLVDPTVLQFFDGEALVQCEEDCPFTDVAILWPDDWRWERYYGLRGTSQFDVPNESRDDLRRP